MPPRFKTRPSFGPRKRQTPAQMLIIGLLVLAWQGWEAWDRARTPRSEGLAALQAAYEAEQSGVMVEATGRIQKVLPDDREGDRHQKFILDIDRRHTVLVSHNIDLAPRAPVQEGDTVTVFGQYEWSEPGGVLHWTHRDPQGRRAGGWIRLKGITYE